MIKIVKNKNIQEHRYACDVCGGLLEGTLAVEHVVWDMPKVDGGTVTPSHVCSNECHKVVEDNIRKVGGFPGWHSISDHTRWLAGPAPARVQDLT